MDEDKFPNFLRWFHLRIKSGPHTHVALRFLPQADYQAIAPFSIISVGGRQVRGSTEILEAGIRVYRLVLLYKRLGCSSALAWDAVYPRDRDQPKFWSKVIGSGPIVEKAASPPVLRPETPVSPTSIIRTALGVSPPAMYTPPTVPILEITSMEIF
ncbi:hypothetical protein FRC12_006198 [Ceratobasidium sp. 428]|nr:hypothetical protein FRC12_006198 [Ceratobasidium sp. 428]